MTDLIAIAALTLSMAVAVVPALVLHKVDQ